MLRVDNCLVILVNGSEKRPQSKFLELREN
jgi:hypothetical protein